MNLSDLKNWKSILHTMKTKHSLNLNPKGYWLSDQAQTRLRWLYIVYYEMDNDVSKAANRIGVSRQWLSTIKNSFERHKKDPRSLEPKSKAPIHTNNRIRISKAIVNKIYQVREKHPGLGKMKIKRVLKRDYDIKVGSSTINRYLNNDHLLNPKISATLKKAFNDKKEKEQNLDILKNIKYRSPLKLNDYAPGAKIEKDMKLIPKIGCKHYGKEDYWYQQTFIDTFTRVRSIELTKDYESKTVAKILEPALKRINDTIATVNTDGGSENHKEVEKKLKELNIIHFESRPGTPTDNPRVERSHKTDDVEFYQQGNIYRKFEDQQQALKDWEWEYNYFRPHQALGYLTPIEFKELYNTNREAAYKIVETYKAYLKKNSERLKKSRQIKGRKKVDQLMQFIDAKLKKINAKNMLKMPKHTCQWC